MIVRIAIFFFMMGCLFQELNNSLHAHSKSQSHSSWWIGEGTVSVIFRLKVRDATFILDPEKQGQMLGPAVISSFTNGVDIKNSAGACDLSDDWRLQHANPGEYEISAEFQCPTDDALTIAMPVLSSLSSSHLHFAKISTKQGIQADHLITSDQSVIELNLSENIPQSISGRIFQYILIGVEHISFGPDHIAFLIGILLLSYSVKSLLILVTGFTIGHSISLALAISGVIAPDIRIIEILIGFTVLLVGAEVFARRYGAYLLLYGLLSFCLLLMLVINLIYAGQHDRGLPVLILILLAVFSFLKLNLSGEIEKGYGLNLMVTIMFGLIHGVGFADALAQYDLNAQNLWVSLVGFNLGVELGQILILMLIAVVIHILNRAQYHRAIILSGDISAVVLCAIGTFWFISRGIAA